MAKVFGASHIPFAICTSMTQLCTVQAEGAGALILSEEALLAEGTELEACLGHQAVWSDLPVLVLSRSGFESVALAGLVERLGNVSVVERPVRTSTLVSLVRSGLRARERQYQVREYLLQQEHAQQTIRESVEAERAARTQAERASRLKDEFLATLSHELRTPLNAVLGWTRLLRKSPGLPDDALGAATVIERNARAQAQIIEDLLDMSSIISGKVRLELQQVDLPAIVAATVETVQPTADAKGVRLQATLEGTPAPVRGDSNRLQQVLWNLLTNAVKFSPKDNLICITLRRVQSHVEVEVRDNGEGIHSDFLPYVFDRFRQADPSSKRRHGGLGLGLSIVKQLVELHGGSVTAQSAGRNMGATFRVALPLMDVAEEFTEPDAMPRNPSAAANHTTQPDSPAIDLAGLKVLVVDDEEDARFLTQRLLQDCNASVITAGSAEEALRALQRDSPHVLISDIGMPEADGYLLLQRIRSLPEDEHSRIPAVALTAYARVEDRARILRAGFQAHLAKPVNAVELVATLQSLTRVGVGRDT